MPSLISLPLIVATLVVALVSGLLAPIADHHYAERLPLHDHVHFGPPDPDHVHPYEVSHDHVHDVPGADPGAAPKGGERGATVFLPAGDDVLLSLAPLAAPTSTVSLVSGPDNPGLLPFFSGDNVLSEVFTAPPYPPPRA